MKIRLYFKDKLSENSKVFLEKDSIHYLKTVLKVKTGDEIFLFNNEDGEFSCTIINDGKSVSIKVNKFNKKDEENKFNLILVFSLIKNSALADLLDKCTQVGVFSFMPIITKHSSVHHFAKSRAEKIVIEASEQSNRTCIPEVFDVISFEKFISQADEKNIIFCDERANFTKENILNLQIKGGDFYLLLGPEGGFSFEEKMQIESLKNAQTISLGKHILRAETAGVCACFLINLFSL